MKICVIPARGGSKRIPRKNIRHFAGKPMIAYSISVAKASGLFDRVVVSTDDMEIAQIAREWGAETPFNRPDELADDHTPTVPVIAHAIQAFEEINGEKLHQVCCIYSCAPFIEADDLRESLILLNRTGTDYCFPVAEYPSAVQRAMVRDGNGHMIPLYPQYELVRTQDIEKTYHDVGQFYWGTKQAWLTNPRVLSCATGFPIPGWRAVDIDTLEDWDRAERIYRVFLEHEQIKEQL
jgi:pseudaminic acid cytidylyltransferase